MKLLRILNEAAKIRPRQLINEAQYDAAIAAVVRKYPDSADVINWAKNLKKQDRVIWYLRAIEPLITTGKLESILAIQEKLMHFLGQAIPKIESYIFPPGKSPDVVFQELQQVEDAWQEQQNKTAPVKIQRGDKPIIEFSDRTAWWFVNRAFCSDEGRSGQHCGNVVGKHRKKQRILSYRTPQGQVILTFILEPDGSLGEMKAKGNKKPDPRFHPAIMSLLLSDMIKGISGEGYLPDMNFSVFDLSHENQLTLLAKKKKLVTDQINVTPLELLNAPPEIKNDPAFNGVVIKQFPGTAALFQENSADSWTSAIESDQKIIVYAPSDIPGYREQLLSWLAGKPEDLLKVNNKAIRNNYDFLAELVTEEGAALRYILPTMSRYIDLCLVAVRSDGRALQHIPKELRTPEICLMAVRQDGNTLSYVPEELRTPELCLIAVKQDGWALGDVPEELRTPELCLIAVKQDGKALRSVPNELHTPELYSIAVKQDGHALEYVPVELRTPELCLIAVRQSGYALPYVPPTLRTPELCLIAVRQDGYTIKYVPASLKREVKRMAGL